MTTRSKGKRRTTKAALMMFMMLIFTVVGEPVDSHGHLLPCALACVFHMSTWQYPNSKSKPNNHDLPTQFKSDPYLNTEPAPTQHHLFSNSNTNLMATPSDSGLDICNKYNKRENTGPTVFGSDG